MTKLTSVICFLFLIFSFAEIVVQKIDLKLDYTVRYLLQKSSDTIKISFRESYKDNLVLPFDDDYLLDYKAKFSVLFKTILASSISFDIPQNVFAYAKNKGNQGTLRALKIKKFKLISTDLNFYIK